MTLKRMNGLFSKDTLTLENRSQKHLEQSQMIRFQLNGKSMKTRIFQFLPLLVLIKKFSLRTAGDKERQVMLILVQLFLTSTSIVTLKTRCQHGSLFMKATKTDTDWLNLLKHVMTTMEMLK